LIWEHVNPYGRFELDMETRLPIDRPIWRLVTRLLGLGHIAAVGDRRVELAVDGGRTQL
jgi:hypothetical protein